LLLAGELALAAVDVVVVERRTGQSLVGSRAAGISARTLEVFDQRGIVDRFLAEGRVSYEAHYSGIFFDISDMATRHNYVLALLQYRVEKILADWIGELGVPIHYGRAVTGVSQDRDGVEIAFSDGRRMHAAYLVGCDGGRSVIRKTAGMAFDGWDPTISCLVADVEMNEEPPWGLHRQGGFHSFFQFDGESTVRVMVTEAELGSAHEPTLDDIREALVTARGTVYGLSGARWISRFTDATRQAASYRDGRVLLAGDAAHIHFPIGGQGLNTGVQDAVNLGWKLAQVAHGTSAEALLDSYHAERHPVAARVLHNTMAQSALNATGERIDALRATVAELLQVDEARQRVAAMMCGLDIHYDLGDGHPLLGRRIPDLDLHTADAPAGLFRHLHDARGCLVRFDPPGHFDVSRWQNRVDVIDARNQRPCQLPVLGEVAPFDAVLVRPDGYVAWVGEGTDRGLTDALDRWFR
jgi:2-polyprenyl-6-methoxyphenol hydroxylase-like FAD-dependent oxidoreductase